MSQRCACLPWRSDTLYPASPFPSYPALPRPYHQGEPELDAGFLPGPCSLALGPPGSTHSPVATIFNMSFSSPCQLALQRTPPLSDIFVFTDASPKDAFLTNRVESLTRERRCRVSAVLAT